MKPSLKRVRFAALATMVVGMSVSFGAAPALAAEVSATWKTGGTMHWQGSVKVTPPSGTPVVCEGGSSGTALGSQWALSNATHSLFGNPLKVMQLQCPSSKKLEFFFNDEFGAPPPSATYDTVAAQYKLWSAGGGPEFAFFLSPFGNYWAVPFSMKFTNGTGGLPSVVTFSKTVIGYIASGPLTLDGTFNVDNTKGGTLTLTH
jgi:hypothetical protein